MRTKDRGIRALHQIVRAIAANKNHLGQPEWDWLMSRLVHVEYRNAVVEEPGKPA